MNEPTIVRDAAGNILSSRNADGTGYDATYDAAGNKVTYRHTNGFGYDATYDRNGKMLTWVDFLPEPKSW